MRRTGPNRERQPVTIDITARQHHNNRRVLRRRHRLRIRHRRVTDGFALRRPHHGHRVGVLDAADRGGHSDQRLTGAAARHRRGSSETAGRWIGYPPQLDARRHTVGPRRVTGDAGRRGCEHEHRMLAGVDGGQVDCPPVPTISRDATISPVSASLTITTSEVSSAPASRSTPESRTSRHDASPTVVAAALQAEVDRDRLGAGSEARARRLARRCHREQETWIPEGDRTGAVERGSVGGWQKVPDGVVIDPSVHERRTGAHRHRRPVPAAEPASVEGTPDRARASFGLLRHVVVAVRSGQPS